MRRHLWNDDHNDYTTEARKPCARQTQANLEQCLKHRCESRLLTLSLSLSFTPCTPIHTLYRQCDDYVTIYFYNSSIWSYVAGDMKRVWDKNVDFEFMLRSIVSREGEREKHTLKPSKRLVWIGWRLFSVTSISLPQHSVVFSLLCRAHHISSRFIENV